MPDRAAERAVETAVSPRQSYRDIATLRAGGALIDGASGPGYRLTEDPALPPQSFSRLEIEAPRLAIEALRMIGDPTPVAAGRDALARIVATLPEQQARQAVHAVMKTFTPPTARPAPLVDPAVIRAACRDERALAITYRDLNERPGERVIWPLGLSASEQHLMLLAHCRLRMDFRTFHVGRSTAAAPTGESFRPHRVALLRDYIASRPHPRADQAATGLKIAVARSQR